MELIYHIGCCSHIMYSSLELLKSVYKVINYINGFDLYESWALDIVYSNNYDCFCNQIEKIQAS